MVKISNYSGGTLLASVAANPDEGTRFYALDHLGTPRLLTNPCKAMVAQHAYYPFGMEATSTSQDSERMKFTGQERDLMGTYSSQTDDLDNFHARSFNPNILCFISADPLRGDPRRPQSFNLFAYVSGNPVNFVDLFGMNSSGPCPPPFEDRWCEGVDVVAPLASLLEWLNSDHTPGNTTVDPNGRGPGTQPAHPRDPQCLAIPAEVLQEAQTNELLASQLFGPQGVPGIESVGGPLEFMIFAGTGDLARAGYSIGVHAAERMAERGVSERMVQTALRKGAMYFDPKNGTVNYDLEGGFASGKSLLVGQNPETGVISTVIRGNNLVRPRFVPYC